MKMSNKEILERAVKCEPNELRCLLLPRSYAFSRIMKLLKSPAGKENEKKLKLLSLLKKRLKLPPRAIGHYRKYGRFDAEDIDLQETVFIISANDDNCKDPITETGVYLKICPGKTNRYYLKVMEEIRSLFPVFYLTGEEIDNLSENGVCYASKLLEQNKLKKIRHQHGLDLKKDVTTYLECEKCIEETFSTQAYDTSLSGLLEEELKNEEKRLVKDAIEYAAENLKISPKHVSNVYYEVCERYNLPTVSFLRQIRNL